MNAFTAVNFTVYGDTVADIKVEANAKAEKMLGTRNFNITYIVSENNPAESGQTHLQKERSLVATVQAAHQENTEQPHAQQDMLSPGQVLTHP